MPGRRISTSAKRRTQTICESSVAYTALAGLTIHTFSMGLQSPRASWFLLLGTVISAPPFCIMCRRASPWLHHGGASEAAARVDGCRSPGNLAHRGSAGHGAGASLGKLRFGALGGVTLYVAASDLIPRSTKWRAQIRPGSAAGVAMVLVMRYFFFPS